MKLAKHGFMVAAFASLVGCGGTPKAPAGPGSGSGSAVDAPPPTQDVTMDLDVVKLQGVTFRVEAFGRPPMMMLVGDKNNKLSIDKLRAAYAKATGAAKETAAQVLATRLYTQSRKETDEAKKKAGLDDSRAVLAEARTAAAGKASDNTLRMMGALALVAGDCTGLADAFGELVTRFPDAKTANSERAWLGFCQLRTNKNADALAATSSVTPDPAEPELAYVTAWAKMRAGDGPGAIAGIKAAAKGWKTDSSRPQIARDLLVIMARGGAPAADAVAALTDFFAGKPPVATLFNLHNAYAFAGRWSDAIAVLEALIATQPDLITKNDLPKFRGLEAQYAMRSLDADKAAAFLEQSVAAYQACGDKCTEAELNDGYGNVKNNAVFVHVLYQTSLDERFYAPAKRIYALYQGLPNRPDAAEIARNLTQLEQVKTGAKPGTGTHDKSIISPLIARHAEEVKGCYEAVLAGDASVSGALSVTIEVDMSGKVTGATSAPAGGKEGLAKVAACATDAARTWILPTRGTKGTTRITAKYELAPAPTK
jgi:tetratricopeptide (TPR) repeat protein